MARESPIKHEGNPWEIRNGTSWCFSSPVSASLFGLTLSADFRHPDGVWVQAAAGSCISPLSPPSSRSRFPGEALRLSHFVSYIHTLNNRYGSVRGSCQPNSGSRVHLVE